MERDGYEVDHETLRRWLLAAGLWKRQRKRAKHRQQRERKAHFGELVQMDGSHHRWFEDRGEERCLMDMVDDATGKTLALLSEEETTVAAMKVLWAWVEKYGIPGALYVDWKNVYVTQREPTLEEHLDGSIHVVYRDRDVLFTETKGLPRKPMVTHQKQQNPQPKKKYIPSSTHPWRKFNLQISTEEGGSTGIEPPEDISIEF